MVGFVSDFGSASSQQVQDVNNLIVLQIRSKDWSVMIDLKDAYFPNTESFSGLLSQAKLINIGFFLLAKPCHLTPSRNAWMQLWLLCDSRASMCSITLTTAYSHRVWRGGSLRCCSHSHEVLGVETKLQEECAFFNKENHFLVWNSNTMQAHLSPTHIEPILMAMSKIRLS